MAPSKLMEWVQFRTIITTCDRALEKAGHQGYTPPDNLTTLHSLISELANNEIFNEADRERYNPTRIKNSPYAEEIRNFLKSQPVIQGEA